MAIDYPPVFINYYLAAKVYESIPDYYFKPSLGIAEEFFSDGPTDPFDFPLRFFPTQPTSIDTLTEEFPEASENVFAVYDRMFRMRRSPFPHIRTEQLLYYFYKTAGDLEALIETTQVVADLLDNGDESAVDLNNWIKKIYQEAPVIGDFNTTDEYAKNDISEPRPFIRIRGKDFYLPYFHEFKIFQLEEARDIIDFGTARTYAANKLIIDYTWHKTV